MKNLFLLSKPNFKWLLSLCLVVLLSLTSNSLLAQPTSFDVTACAGQPGSDGSYTQGADHNSCPCYERSGGGAIFKNSSFWNYQSGVSCTTITTGGILFDQGVSSCDISTAISSGFGGCNPSVLSNLQYAAASTASVPTLSEWGLIVLALMFMTAGTLYLVQPNFRKSFEEK
ncbi:MAG: IPTL-CTERM sorting domain-containing protein [Chitinophagales bacterium]